MMTLPFFIYARKVRLNFFLLMIIGDLVFTMRSSQLALQIAYLRTNLNPAGHQS
jgi:hypothetical protein